MRSGAPTPERIPRQVLLKKPLRFIFFVLTTDLVSCYLVVQLCLSLSYQPHVVYDSPQLLVNNSNTLCHHSDLSAVAPFTLRT